MAVDATVLNGEVTNVKTDSTSSAKKDGSTLDKQAFLQLLVAQMKYQDPLEPTDNTEYVAQLAQFSSLEAMNNMGETMDMQRAAGLIGKVVTASTTNETTGVTTEVTGTVDKITHSGSKTYVIINGEQYNLDDVKEVIDSEYAEADSIAETWRQTYNELPDISKIDSRNAEQYKDAIQNLVRVFNSMSQYQQSFLTDSEKNGIAAYVQRLKDYDIQIEV